MRKPFFIFFEKNVGTIVDFLSTLGTISQETAAKVLINNKLASNPKL